MRLSTALGFRNRPTVNISLGDYHLFEIEGFSRLHNEKLGVTRYNINIDAVNYDNNPLSIPLRLPIYVPKPELFTQNNTRIETLRLRNANTNETLYREYMCVANINDGRFASNRYRLSWEYFPVNGSYTRSIPLANARHDQLIDEDNNPVSWEDYIENYANKLVFS